MIVQIYEIQTPQEAERMIELGVDHIGSVLLSEAEWKVPMVKDTLSAVAASTAQSSLIPLFNRPETVFRVIDDYRPDILHFCEAIPLQNDVLQTVEPLIKLQQAVKERYEGVRIMRSVPIGRPGAADGERSLAVAREFAPYSDFFLTDTLLTPHSEDQPVAGFVGITGKICDWDVARKLVDRSPIPVILAGGISPENAVQGIRKVRPYGIDSCTGTNAVDASGKPIRFKKDPEKVRQLVAAAGNRQEAEPLNE